MIRVMIGVMIGVAATPIPANNPCRLRPPATRPSRMQPTPPPHPRFPARLVACAVLACATCSRAQPAPQTAGAWDLAGRQGLIQVVIVPPAQARDREAYARQVALLCPPQASCFINFFTNSAGAPLSVPLPDAIANEPTAIFRRSTKQGAELFRWSCRMGTDEGNCF